MIKKLAPIGFSLIELLLVLAVVFLVGGWGAYTYTKHHKNPASTPVKTTKPVAPANSSTSPGGIPASAGHTAPTSPSTPVLTEVRVESAGLSLNVPASLKDLTYQVSGSLGNKQSVTFSTATLTAAAPTCSASSPQGAFDTIIRGPGSYTTDPNGGLIKQYSNFYIAYLIPAGPCAHNLSPANQTLLDTQMQDFYGALGNTKAL